MSHIWDIIFSSCKSHSSQRLEPMELRVAMHAKPDLGYTPVPPPPPSFFLLPGAGTHRIGGTQTIHNTLYNTMHQAKDKGCGSRNF